MKRDGTPLWRFSIWVLIPVLMASVTASSSGDTASRDAGESEPASRQAVDEDTTPGAMRVAEAAAAARERRHITPRQKSMRRSHRRLENPEQLVVRAEVMREFAGAGHGYLQFDEIPDHARQRLLRTRGILLTGYAGNNTYFAAVTEEGREFLSSTTGIVEGGKIPIEDKAERDLLEGVIPDWAKDDLGRAVVHVRFHETVALEEARSILESHGGMLLDERGYRGFFVLDAAIDGEATGDLAGSDRVRSISAKAPEFVPFNAAAAAVSGIDLLWDPPYNLNGAGYTVGVWDGTANYAHAEFGDRLTLIDWNDPVDLASMGFPDQHAIMVVEGHTPTETQFITQNSNTTLIEPTASKPCYEGSGPTTDHSWMRVFDLNIEHYIGDLYCVDSLRYAVEDASGNPDVTFNVYCAPQHTADDNPGTIYLDQLSLQYSTTIDHPDMQMAFRDQPLQGCCYAPPTAGMGGYDLVIEITSEDCVETGNCDHFFLGSNDEGQTKPTYFSALDCEIFPADPAAYSTHATHVAGTIGASGAAGVGTSEAHGMANQVNLSMYDFFGFNQDYLDAIAAGEIVASNNGWGYDIGWYWFEGCTHEQGCLPEVPAGWYYRSNTGDFGKYSLESRRVDYTAFIAENSGQPFPIVFAAGNERDDGPPGAYDGTYHYNPDETRTYYDTINPLAGSKNAITVGSIDGNRNMTPYSSWGPCDDGRIKPDLVAKGHGLNSPSGPGFNDYYVMLGTSMAAAVVSGSAVLVVEQYEDTFGTVPTNGEIKALLINSTIDLGKPGPDYIYGYGLLDAREAVETILDEGDTSSIYSGVVSHAQTDTYGLNVPEGTPTIKATLAWMDWPGNYQSAFPKIVNDLDLRLISPTGRSHYPFSLSVSDPVAPATATGLNLLDTVEQVVVEDPEAGMWTLEVKGSSVPQGPQPYGLVSRSGLVAPTIFDMLPPPVLYNFPYPYTTGIMSAKYVDLSGSGIDLGTVTMRANWFDVTDDAVITTEGAFYVPWYALSELDEHWFEVTVGSASGLQTSAVSIFNFVEAEEVEGLQLTPGVGGSVDLAWGDPGYDPMKLLLKEFRVYRSTDIGQELEWIGSTSDHFFTDGSPPVADMVAYEVHALFEAGSLNEILSTRNTPHRTRQPFIAYPRDVAVEPLPAGDTAIRILGMAEPESDMTIYVDGFEVGTTTTLEDGSFVYVHDFGGPGSHSVFVQSKAAGKSISVPSVEVDLQLLP